MRFRAPLFSALLGLALAPPAPLVAAELATPSPYTALAALEHRVAAIGFRLTTANVGWCSAVQPQFGWIWGDRRLYDAGQWDAARAAYNASAADTPFVAAIAPNSPAAMAGLAVGDPVIPAGGSAARATASDAFVRIDAMERYFAALSTQEATRITGRDDRPVQLTPVAGCTSDFRVEARNRPSGGADGRLVLISAGLARFAGDDSELAAAIAHELAHNILRHRARLDAVGVKRDLAIQNGRSARLIRQTEVEADRLSVWLLAGAGYDPAASVRFWQKFGKRNGPQLFQPGTHPRWRARVKSLEAEIAALDAAKAKDGELRPPLVDAPPPLE